MILWITSQIRVCTAILSISTNSIRPGSKKKSRWVLLAQIYSVFKQREFTEEAPVKNFIQKTTCTRSFCNVTQHHFWTDSATAPRVPVFYPKSVSAPTMIPCYTKNKLQNSWGYPAPVSKAREAHHLTSCSCKAK